MREDSFQESQDIRKLSTEQLDGAAGVEIKEGEEEEEEGCGHLPPPHEKPVVRCEGRVSGKRLTQ